ncbi:MAG: hypothetical protein O7G84_13980 [Gammaproteobacteria bacterium]|nr:hypothetical protein [Gammaproteobacteria bacterium]
MKKTLGWMIALSALFALQANALQSPNDQKAYAAAIERLGILEEINVTAYKPAQESTDLDPAVAELLKEAEEAEAE